MRSHLRKFLVMALVVASFASVASVTVLASHVPAAHASDCDGSGEEATVTTTSQPNMHESIGLRGPRPTGTPPTFGPGTGGWAGTPMPTGGIAHPPNWLPTDECYEVICTAWDYVKNICVGWKRKRRDDGTERAQPYPIQNAAWADGKNNPIGRLGSFGTVDPGTMYCFAWEYVYTNSCVGWKRHEVPFTQPYPVPAFYYVSVWSLDYFRQGFYDGQIPWWYWDTQSGGG